MISQSRINAPVTIRVENIRWNFVPRAIQVFDADQLRVRSDEAPNAHINRARADSTQDEGTV
jgi:hypothetical protein